ncbi:hypothetical protein [Coleofasciculus sp.]|uniref:hypothetical protein n=1 Tax=Coleofasciculus sp. TaxID=3100458 RepID=UPI0039F934F5
MATGYIVAFGEPGANPNTISNNIYGVVDGTGVILADGANNADLVDQASFFSETPTGLIQVKELEATLQAQQPDRNFSILVVNRTTTITDPAGLAVTVEP